MRAHVVVLLAALATRPDAANQCNDHQITVIPELLPLGCPLSVIVHPDDAPAFSTQLFAERGAPGATTRVPLTATVTQSIDPLPDTLVHIDPDTCETSQQIKVVDYRRFEFDIADAQVGDRIEVGYYASALVGDAGPCPIVGSPSFSCSDPVQPCQHPPGGNEAGCQSSGGAGGIASAAVLLGPLFRRRRVGRRVRGTRRGRVEC